MARRILLRHPTSGDQRAFLLAVRRSEALHRPWVSPPATPARFTALLKRMKSDEYRSFLVCTRDGDELAGTINISNIVMGMLRSGYLGYYAFAGFEGRGLMREGILAVVRLAFTKLKLHRLEANIQPANAASIALVRSCGFVQEGYSPRYLKIGGRWRDHQRWAIRSS